METKSLVSVVVPTYNSARTLDKCLKSIRDQSYKNLEIIVVDGFSTDTTLNIIKNYKCKLLVKHGERTSNKNLGIKNAKGRYVCFIDSDMILSKNVIKECINLIKYNEKVFGIIIPEKSVGNSFWVKVRAFERGFYSNTNVETPRFYLTSLVRKVSGFDEDIIFFEETTLFAKLARLGYKNYKHSRSKIYHLEYTFSLIKWLKKKYYYGLSASNYSRKYNEYAKKQLSLYYRINIFLSSKRFYSKPVLACGVILLKFFEYISITLGELVGRER